MSQEKDFFFDDFLQWCNSTQKSHFHHIWENSFEMSSNDSLDSIIPFTGSLGASVKMPNDHFKKNDTLEKSICDKD